MESAGRHKLYARIDSEPCRDGFQRNPAGGYSEELMSEGAFIRNKTYEVDAAKSVDILKKGQHRATRQVLWREV